MKTLRGLALLCVPMHANRRSKMDEPKTRFWAWFSYFQFFEWQPCHFPVMVLCLFRKFYLGSSKQFSVLKGAVLNILHQKEKKIINIIYSNPLHLDQKSDYFQNKIQFLLTHKVDTEDSIQQDNQTFFMLALLRNTSVWTPSSLNAHSLHPSFVGSANQAFMPIRAQYRSVQKKNNFPLIGVA